MTNRPAVGRAPGRVNLIGEHTDYNQGYVFPIATPQQTTIALTPRTDGRVRMTSVNMAADQRDAEYELGREQRQGRWIDYIQGVTVAVREAGHTLSGFDGQIQSDVPLGAGLSSSASLELALVRALIAAFDLRIDPVAAARIGHTAETAFVGVPIGIMDQMAASLATVDAALFLDTRTLEFEQVRVPPAAELIVINSGITHSHATGEYRTRRAECDEAARRLGVTALRDIEPAQLGALSLPAPLDRRVRHVVTENARVLEMRGALHSADLAQAGAAMTASHRSMRDDFEVSIPEIDLMVEAAVEQAAVFGARLTGGGFGGCIVVLAERGHSAAIGQQIVRRYAEQTGRTATVLIP